MNRSSAPLWIVLVCLAAGAGGYWLYREHTKSGVEVSVGGRTLSIETR